MPAAAAGRIDADDQVLLLAGQEVWSALDVQNAVFIDSYRRESARLQRRDLQRQQSTLDALVEGRGADPQIAAEARDVLGVGAEMTVACVVAPYDGSLDEPVTPMEDRLERLGFVSHWHVRGGVYFGLLAGDLGERGGAGGAAAAARRRPGGTGGRRRTVSGASRPRSSWPAGPPRPSPATSAAWSG